MSEQTSAAETVRIPGQGGSHAAAEGYRPRHRATRTDPDGPQESTVIAPIALFVRERRRSGGRAAPGASAPVRRATRPVAPAGPVVPHQVRRVYDTPVWVPPPHSDEQAASYLALDEQSEDPFARPDGMLREAQWTSMSGARVAAGLLLVGFLAAAVASGSGLLEQQSTPTLALTLGCLLGAAGVYAVLVALRPVVVELAEPWLVVRHGDRHDHFNLASPFQGLQVSGRPGSRKWRLSLGCPDGRDVRLTDRMVDSRRLDVVIGYAQAIAERERAARDERFNL